MMVGTALTNMANCQNATIQNVALAKLNFVGIVVIAPYMLMSKCALIPAGKLKPLTKHVAQLHSFPHLSLHLKPLQIQDVHITP